MLTLFTEISELRRLLASFSDPKETGGKLAIIDVASGKLQHLTTPYSSHGGISVKVALGYGRSNMLKRLSLGQAASCNSLPCLEPDTPMRLACRKSPALACSVCGAEVPSI